MSRMICMARPTGQFFLADSEVVMAAVNELNEQLIFRKRITLNEFIERLNADLSDDEKLFTAPWGHDCGFPRTVGGSCFEFKLQEQVLSNGSTAAIISWEPTGEKEPYEPVMPAP